MGKLKLDPAFVAKMDCMLQSRAPRPARSRAPARGPTAAVEEEAGPRAPRPRGPATTNRSCPPPAFAAPKPAPSDLFVIDRSIMEELVSAYVEKHVKSLPGVAATAPSSSPSEGPPPEKQKEEPGARFVVQRTSKATGKLVQRTVDAGSLRSTDRILHMVIS